MLRNTRQNQKNMQGIRSYKELSNIFGKGTNETFTGKNIIKKQIQQS
jgi:hypothetical protein